MFQPQRRRVIDGVKYLVVAGELPTKQALERAVHKGWGVLVEELSPGIGELSFLGPVIDRLTHIIVAEGGRLDTSVLQHASSLVSLDVWARPTLPTELAHLPLERFAGRAHKNWRSLQHCNSLRVLMLEHGDFSWGESLPALEQLQLSGLRGDVVVPGSGGVGFTKLRNLSLHGSGGLDVRNLREMPGLRRVELSGFSTLRGSAVLGSRPLDRLTLEGIGEIDDVTWMTTSLPLRELIVIGTSGWIERVERAELIERPGWRFPPG